MCVCMCVCSYESWMWGLKMCIRTSLTLYVGTWRKWGLTLSPHFEISHIGYKWGPEAHAKVLDKSPNWRPNWGVYHTLHNLPSEWVSALVDTLVRAALFKKEFRFLTITNKTKWRPGASSNPKDKVSLETF